MLMTQFHSKRPRRHSGEDFVAFQAIWKAESPYLRAVPPTPLGQFEIVFGKMKKNYCMDDYPVL